MHCRKKRKEAEAKRAADARKKAEAAKRAKQVAERKRVEAARKQAAAKKQAEALAIKRQQQAASQERQRAASQWGSQIERHVKRHWNPPPGTAGQVAKVRLEVSSSGYIKGFQFVQCNVQAFCAVD